MSGAAEPPHEQVERWRLLVDHLPALVAYWDRDLRNVLANAAYVRWFGRTPEEMLGIHIEDLLGPSLYRANKPFIDGALAGHHQRFDRTLVTAAGDTRYTQAEYIPRLTDDGVAGFFVLVADVTEHVLARRDLAAAQSLAGIGGYTYEPATGTLRLSPEVLTMLGLDPEGPGPSLEEYLAAVHPDDRDRVQLPRGQTGPDGEHETGYRVVGPDGTVRHVHSRTSRVLGPDGAVVLLRGVMQDQTESQRLADEVATTNRLLTDLIGMLGHDLAQPVTATNGYLEVLEQEWDHLDTDERRSLVRRAARTGMRSQGLLADILALVSIGSSTLTTRPGAVDLVAVLDEARDHARLTFTLTSETRARAWADPVHVARIIDNLLVNAARYGRAPYTVAIREEAHEVVVSLRDHGEGVPPGFVPHLFERFSRAETGVAARVTGTGFGLYLVRGLARANHGEVCHRVPSDGAGAVFEVRLPVARTAPDPL